MDKLIPDPPFNTTIPNAEALRAESLLKDRDAIKLALDYYLDPPDQYTENPRRPGRRYRKPPGPRLRIVSVSECHGQ